MAAIRKNDDLNETIKHWKYIANDIHFPMSDGDYEQLSKVLDRLLDRVGEDENHELIGLVDVISHMISMYDDQKKYQIKNISGIKSLKYLMELHDLTQADLSDIASQGVISEILNGKRKLNLSQMKKLAHKFKVSIETFVD